MNNKSSSDAESFDIVIPVGPSDRKIIEEQIAHTKKNVLGYRRIYLIPYDPSLTVPGCITVNENIFPFSKKTVEKYHGKCRRNGWYFQQLLKLYAGKIIPGILDKYLIIDSDTLFLKPTLFIEDGRCLYNYGKENHEQYFKHMARLDPDLKRMNRAKSGICHHMMFETKYIDEIFSKIEAKHGDLFYNVFLKNVDKNHVHASGASEYEIYFNYMLKNHSDKIKIRRLHWQDTKKINVGGEYDYVSLHAWMQK
jgi:hypothetical protein